jgi:hypothetical protein
MKTATLHPKWGETIKSTLKSSGFVFLFFFFFWMPFPLLHPPHPPQHITGAFHLLSGLLQDFSSVLLFLLSKPTTLLRKQMRI